MTDPYNGDTEHYEPGQDEAHPAEPVGHPDAHEFTEAEEAEASEHTEEHDEEHGAGEEPKRRPAGLAIAAAVGGVLLLGMAAWWQFGSSATPDAPAFVPPASAPVETAIKPAPAPVTPAAPVPPSAPLSDSAALAPAPAAVTPAAPVPAPAQEPVNNTTPVSAVVPAAPAPASVIPAPMPSTAPALPAAANPSLASAAASEDQRVQELADRVADLQKALDAANAHLNEVANMVAAKASPVGENAGIAASPAPAARPHAHRHATPVKKPAHKSSAAHEFPAAPSALTHHWVLRAAVPGQAWISPDASSTELKQIKPGDSVPGAGTVTAITHQGDDWVVQTTKGTIR